MVKKNPYRAGLDRLLAKGLGRCTEDRVLLRAIMRTDEGALLVAKTDTLDAVCHEIVDVGPDVNPEKYPVGHHCIHLSAAADAADFLNPEARYVMVRARHIVRTWHPAEAIALDEKIEREEQAARLALDSERAQLRR